MWSNQQTMRAYYAQYQRTRQQRWRQAGACVTCGLPCDLNPATQRPFARCRRHRLKTARYSQAYHQRHGRPDKRSGQQEAAA